MIIDDFYMNVELYRRGLFDKIQFYDHYQNSVFKFHPKQIVALRLMQDDKTTSVGYGGAARGGKTILMVLDALFGCYAYDQTRYLMGRKDLTMFHQTTFKSLQRCLDNFGFQPGVDYWHNKQKNEIYFFEPKSEIIIKNLELKPSDKDATSFGSLEITKAYIDQSEHVDLKIIEKVTERVGSYGTTRHGIKGKCFEAFNPSKTHVNKRFYQPYKANIKNESVAFVPALPSDNPSPEARQWVLEKEKDYRDGIMSEQEYQKQIKGNFDYSDDDASLIKYDAILDYFNGEHLKTSEKDKMYLTIDPARLGKDKTVYRVWKGWKCIARYQLLMAKETEVVAKAKLIQRKHGITNSHTVVDANGLGGGVADNIGCREFINNATQIGDLGNFKSLKDQCCILMARKIQNREAAEICHDHKVREETQEEMEQVRILDLEADGKEGVIKKDEIKKRIARSPDEWDSIFMRYYFELDEEIWVM